jgi:hypothetical protein
LWYEHSPVSVHDEVTITSLLEEVTWSPELLCDLASFKLVSELATCVWLCCDVQVGGVIAGALYIAIEEMQFPGGGTKGGGLFVG